MTKVLTKSDKETFSQGEKIAQMSEKYNGRQALVLALLGNLGSGKTTFTQGLAKELGVRGKVISPTFILMRSYDLPKRKKFKTLYHIDLYRLDNPGEAIALGLQEIFSKSENIVVIEWAEKIRELLPAQTKWIEFKQTNLDERLIQYETIL